MAEFGFELILIQSQFSSHYTKWPTKHLFTSSHHYLFQYQESLVPESTQSLSMKSSNVLHGGLDWMDTDTFLADFLLGE